MDYPTPLLVEGNWLFYAIAAVISVFAACVVIKVVTVVSRYLVGLHNRARAREAAEQQALRVGQGSV